MSLNGRVHPPPSKILVYSLSSKTGQGFFCTAWKPMIYLPVLSLAQVTLDHLGLLFFSWQPSWGITVTLETQHILCFYSEMNPFTQNALSLCVLSLIGCQILSHLLFSVKSKACWLMKSSVLVSTILRERHKIGIGKSLLVLLLCFPWQLFYGNVKNPDKDKIF